MLLAALAPFAAPTGATSSNSVTVVWTATGDDADAGRAFSYDLRYSDSAVGADTVAWWGSAQSATNLPAPSASGEPDSAIVTDLEPETTYSFILRAYDDGGNMSGFSNVAVATTAAATPPPAPGCSAPSSTPERFQAREASGAVLLSWARTSDPLARVLRIWRRFAGPGNSYSPLVSVSDPIQTSYQDTNVTPGRTYRYRAAWSDSCGDGPGISSSVISIPNSGPSTVALAANNAAALHAYPNPARDAVQFVIHVGGPGGQPVHIRLHDLTGQVIAVIADGSFPSGNTIVSWPRRSVKGDRVAPGYYESIGHIGSSSVRERLVLLP